MPVAFSSALYYPNIDIKNEKWLRSAALFWDSIRTIVPGSMNEPYSNDFARELCDEGVLAPVRVSSDMAEVEQLTDQVLDFLKDPAAAGVLLDMDGKPLRPGHSQRRSREMENLTHIHPEKLSSYLRQELEYGMDENGWLDAGPGFANFYMTLLATQLSKRLGLGLVTESSAADQLAIAVGKGRPLGSTVDDHGGRRGRHFEAYGVRRSLPENVAPSLLIDMMVQGIALPDDLSAKKIIKFKSDHKEELGIFRKEVARLATDLPKDLAVEALRQAVEDQYKANVQPAMKSLRESLAAQGWDAVLSGFLKMSFFTAAPGSAAVFAGIPGPVALIAGAGISLTASVVVAANQRRKTKTESPYSYLLSMERKFS